jgi:hypothetical protein
MPDPNPPSLSPQAIEDYRRLLGDETFQRESPAQYAMLKASVGRAMAETGQSLSPASDGRSPAQTYHDRQFGVTFAQDGKPEIPERLLAVVDSQADSEAPDPGLVRQHLAAVGLDPAKTIAAAQAVLEGAGEPIAVTQLSAHTIAMLAAQAEHIERWREGRPK